MLFDIINTLNEHLGLSKMSKVTSKVRYYRARVKEYPEAIEGLTSEQLESLNELGSLSPHWSVVKNKISSIVKSSGSRVNTNPATRRSYWVKELQKPERSYLLRAFDTEADIENYERGLLTPNMIEKVKAYSQLYRTRRKNLPPLDDQFKEKVLTSRSRAKAISEDVDPLASRLSAETETSVEDLDLSSLNTQAVEEPQSDSESDTETEPEPEPEPEPVKKSKRKSSKKKRKPLQ